MPHHPALLLFPEYVFSMSCFAHSDRLLLLVGYGVAAMALVDVAGLLFRWRLFDHAAHLGGTLFSSKRSTVYLNLIQELRSERCTTIAGRLIALN